MLRLLKDRKGQGMVEYGLILSLVAIVAMVGLGPMGTAIDAIFDAIVAAL